MKAKIITFGNFKGGTGKTTNSTMVGNALASNNNKTLLIDLINIHRYLLSNLEMLNVKSILIFYFLIENISNRTYYPLSLLYLIVYLH
ncbi:AAA family ATPase [Enterococcus hirae]|nr:AAA family ATPase [Enterococcus hirae]MBO1090015.1 AAA family ATPase [Enterococcus hirae]